MVEWHPLLKKSYWILSGLGALYVVFLGTLTIPTVQRNLLYLHNIKLPYFTNIETPEVLGFAQNQITPFYLDTPDGESLFSWHILPTAAYAQHRSELVKQPQEEGTLTDLTNVPSFNIIKNDPNARVIIFFHGNAGNVAQGWRPDAYRNFINTDTTHAHLLVIDYRGFGRSTGTPTESGLIIDGITLIKFAINTLGVPASHITVVGHSLGTGVAIGACEKLAREEPSIEIGAGGGGGVVLIASFTSLRSLILTYSIGGFLPVLGPLRPYPIVQRWFSKFIVEPWENDMRLIGLIRASPNLKLSLIHAYLDPDILWTHSVEMFRIAVNAVMEERGVKKDEDVAQDKETGEFTPITQSQIMSRVKREDFGGESWVNTWTEGMQDEQGNKRVVEQRVLKWGGHNQILTSSVVSLVIRQFMGL